MRYRSTFLDADGSQATAVLEAPSEQVLHEQMFANGRTLLHVRLLANSDRGVADEDTRIPLPRLLAFVQSLEGALDAGVNVMTALAAIRDQEQDRRVRSIYDGLIERVEGGQTFADALNGYPRAFSSVLRAMVRAGESSGQLPDVLRSIADYLEWRTDVIGSIKHAAIYPAIVMAAGFGLVLFLLAFVIPALGEVLGKLGGDMPAASLALIALSNYVAGNVGLIVLGTAASIVAAIFAMRTEPGRATLAFVLVRLPVIRNVARYFDLTQFCRNLGVLLRSGLTVTAALDLCGEAIHSRKIRANVAQANERILSGVKLTDSLAGIGILPPIAVSMVRIGEEAGRLPDTFSRLNRLYDRELQRLVKKALAMLEPIVTVLLGIIVGGVAALVITTIYSAMRGLGR